MDIDTLTLSTCDDMEVRITHEGKHVLFQFYDSESRICVFDSEAELVKYLWDLAPAGPLARHLLGQLGLVELRASSPSTRTSAALQCRAESKHGGTRRGASSKRGSVSRWVRAVR